MFSVKQKLFIARILSGLLRFWRRITGRDMHVMCRRRGVSWDLDLDEGIDLSIYLLGAYEPRPLNAYSRLILPGSVVFDIGANVGAHTLHFARLVGTSGQVHAFEPTDYAIAKLRRNLELNPELNSCVELHQSFLVATPDAPLPSAIPSSWPVGGWHDDLHWGHLGKSKALTQAVAITGDEFCRTSGVDRMDFLKIDVDGHEYDVLRGFHDSLVRFRPHILIEIAPFIYEEINPKEFDEFVRFLAGLGYEFADANNGRRIPNDPDALRSIITPGGGINALLYPPASSR